MKTLTIGIPTYNRRNAILFNVKSLLSSGIEQFSDRVEIIIIDNDSPGELFDEIKKTVSSSPIFTVLKNEVNIGYKKNIIRLFQESSAKYVLITSDEDPVIVSNLRIFLEFLSKENPLFVSPIALDVNQLIYRGNIFTKAVDESEWQQAGFYISGLTYERNAALNLISSYEQIILKDNQYYFQSLMIAILLLKGKCMWWNKPITYAAMWVPTVISMEQENPYYSLVGRWNLYNENIFALNHIGQNKKFDSNKISKMVESCQRNFFFHIRGSLAHSSDDLKVNFDVSARRTFSLKYRLLAKTKSWIYVGWSKFWKLKLFKVMKNIE